MGWGSSRFKSGALWALFVGSFLLNASPALALHKGFTKGFNQGWFKQNYGVQWLDRHYDHDYAEGLLKTTELGGGKVFRIWLYEGFELRNFLTKGGRPQNLKLEVLKNLSDFLTLARTHGIKVNLTFFDGNAFRYLEFSTKGVFWREFFNEDAVQKQFSKIAFFPVYELIRKKFKDVVTQIDLTNEVNAVWESGVFQQKQAGISQLLCNMAKGSPAAVTASMGGYQVENYFFDGLLDQACLDFYDLHFYNDEGSIPRCEEFLAKSRSGVSLQLGEFGQSSLAFDDELQSRNVSAFMQSAKKCGFKSALAWRLEDVRKGLNPEARFSFIAYGKLRPAFEVFRNE